MVGYMRRYDPALQALHDRLGELGQIRIVRARDSLGLAATATDIYALVLPKPGAPGRMQDRSAFDAKLAEGLGSDDPRRLTLYWIVLMLGVHDFAVLRSLLGHPSAVVSAEVLGPRHLTTSLGYDSGAIASLELGVWPKHTWTDTELDVVTDTAVATLTFPNPWIRYLPTTLRIRTAYADGTTGETRGPESFHYAFREEWLAFHRAIVDGTEPETSGASGVEDVELAAAIVRGVPSERLDAMTVSWEER
jgi:predicted dehydrogenase